MAADTDTKRLFKKGETEDLIYRATTLWIWTGQKCSKYQTKILNDVKFYIYKYLLSAA